MCFSLQAVSATIFCDITITSTRFLSCGVRVCLLHFLGIFTYIFVLYKWECPRIACCRPISVWEDPWESTKGLLNEFCSSSAKWAIAGRLFLTMLPYKVFPLTDTKYWALRIKKKQNKKKKKKKIITRRGPGIETFFFLFFFLYDEKKYWGRQLKTGTDSFFFRI